MIAHQERYSTGKALIGFLFSPALGLLYIIAMPFIALATVAILLVRKVVAGVVNLTSNLVVFEWRPGETYLTGKKKGKKKDKQETDSPEKQ